MKRNCKDCGKEFTLSQGEIDFFEKKNLNLPKRCKSCREKDKQQKTQGNPPAKPSGATRGGHKMDMDMDTVFVQSMPTTKTTNYKGILAAFLLAMALLATGWFVLSPKTDSEPLPLPSQGEVFEAPSVDPVPEPELESEPSPEQEPDSESTPEQEPDSESTPEPEPDSESTPEQEPEATPEPEPEVQQESSTGRQYKFRTPDYWVEHYEKHGMVMGYASPNDYVAGANRVIYHGDSLTKRQDDGDYLYYLQATNEFVVLAPDGYIRTYFKPSDGIAYYNRQ